MFTFTPGLGLVQFLKVESRESSVAAMEMVEEIPSQPKICAKRIKFQEIEEKGEADRLSALPEYLILEILSRLPSTEDAIRTGTLSKRWKHLWTSIPTLIFTHLDHNHPRSEFFSFVDKTLTQRRQLKLKKLGLYTLYDYPFESKVNNWIRYAISCNVEELILKLYTVSDAECQLDRFFYISSCFTDLTLEGCILNPIGAISWKNLRSLSISNGKLDEDLIENILSGSPVLETLVLNDCYGYRLLNITSKSVKKLVFSGYMDPDAECDDDYEEFSEIIEINAPNILSLSIKGDLLYWKLLLLDVSSLVEANLNYISCKTVPEEDEEEMLKGFIVKLCHVMELKIGVCCSQVVSRLVAKEFEFPSNIKFLDGDYERMKLGDWPESESESESDSY